MLRNDPTVHSGEYPARGVRKEVIFKMIHSLAVRISKKNSRKKKKRRT